jgi:hypothetical protein
MNVYIMYPLIEVQLQDRGTITRTENRQLYSETIKLYKGVDNPVRLLVRNQDQKPVNLAPFDLVVDLIDPYNKIVVASYTASKLNLAKGIAEIVVAAQDLAEIESRFHQFSVKKVVAGQDDRISYIDSYYNAILPVEIHDAYLPYNPTSLDLGETADPNAQNLADLGGLQ